MTSVSKKLLDLTGLEFGEWYVIERAPSHGTNTAWWCLCSCGTVASVTSGALRRAIAKKCKDCQAAGQSSWLEEGYRLLYYPKHPNARKNGRVAEHTVVMSKALGRAILPGETVHHKNGVRDDNRIENLELWVSHQPSGQRPADLVEWAHEILRRYENVVDLSS